jgi:hypothetical protein
MQEKKIVLDQTGRIMGANAVFVLSFSRALQRMRCLSLRRRRVFRLHLTATSGMVLTSTVAPKLRVCQSKVTQMMAFSGRKGSKKPAPFRLQD